MTELKHAFRSLFKSPGFTLIAILTIAIGIGANTALFSTFNTLVLSPINLPDPGRLVRIWTNNKARNVVAPVMSVPKYTMFAEQSTAFSGIAASFFNGAVLTREGGDPEQLNTLNVTASFIPTLQWALARGRNFNADEDKQNGPHVCIITYELWKTHFGKRESIVGETIQLDGVANTVVGVLAEGTLAPFPGLQLIQPYPLAPAFLNAQQIEGGAGFLQITARLKDGITYDKALAEVHSISARYKTEFPGRLDGTNENELRTWIEEQVGPVRPTFILLLSAVGLVLLIACANVSNLFLGRLSARHKEIAVRQALGATRRHLVRQFLLETLIFCSIAATLGIALAAGSLRLIESTLAAQLQSRTTFSLSASTLLFTVGLSLLSSLFIGFIPAIQASRVNLSDVLKDSTRGTVGGARGTRFRGFLIIAEVSLSVVLLVGSSLLLLSFTRLQSTEAGFSTHGVASAFMNPPGANYATPEAKLNFYDRILDNLHANPTVKYAAIAGGLPLGGGLARGVYSIQGQPIVALAERPIAFFNFVSQEYFSVLRIPLKQGRLFQSNDLPNSPGVVIINESFAKRLFPNGDAIGHFLLRGQQADIKLEIVGIVGDVKSIGLNTPPPETMYQALRQSGFGAGVVVAQTAGDPNLLQPILRGAVSAVDKSDAVSAFATMETQLQQSLGVQRITAWLTGAFASVALLLSALGLYSVLAYAVTQRTGEIGIRMALGAGRGNVVGLIISQGMRLVMVGLLVGLGVSAAGSRAISSLLYNVEPFNIGVFGAVTALFSIVAVFACLIPSWRASRIDALVAIRAE